MQTARYSLMQRLVHWAVAITVLCSLTVGLILGTLGFEGARDTFGLDATNALYKYHKSFGVLILGLMALRLALWVINGRPPHGSDMAPAQRLAASVVHWSLYVLLIAMPVIGWMATAAGGFPVEFFGWVLPGYVAKDPELARWLFGVHEIVGYVILGFVAVHIAAALHHWKVRRDRVMHRISLP
jgi:cytochrome b561